MVCLPLPILPSSSTTIIVIAAITSAINKFTSTSPLFISLFSVCIIVVDGVIAHLDGGGGWGVVGGAYKGCGRATLSGRGPGKQYMLHVMGGGAALVCVGLQLSYLHDV